MLRITRQYSTAAVQRYYEHSDYYEEGPKALQGHWFGQGAKRLGLTGLVNKSEFDRVVENRHPSMDGQALTERTRADRVVGADFTFNVSKSVSILWALTQDHRILDSVREAVAETMAEVEEQIETRVHGRTSMHRETTGNLIGASWLHTTARPESNGIPMAHIHVHAWVANATHDGRKHKAIDFANVKALGSLFEARFHSRLASRLQESLGVAIERQGKKWFEIAGVDRDIIDQFSERTRKIEKVAREKGITDPEAKSKLGAKTRKAKSKGISSSELPELWRWMLGPKRAAVLKDSIYRAASQTRERINAKEAVDYAVEHQFSGKASVKESRILTDAIWRGIGDVAIRETDREFGKRKFLRVHETNSTWVTTEQVLREERFLLGFARNGLGSAKPLAAGQQIQRDWLSGEQKSAVRELWNKSDRVMVLAGKAGTGKSTLAREACEGMQRAGHDIAVVAPTTKAVSVLKKDGFRANTLAKLLTNKKMQEETKGKVILLDEAGLVSSPDMAKLFRLAGQLGSRVILSGDTFQNTPVGRGRPLELIEKEAGVKPITITKIRRQKDDALRQAVEKLSRGEVRAGFSDLEKMGAVKVLPDKLRDRMLAHRYVDAIEAGESALVIAPTHIEKNRITRALRDELRKRGHISPAERDIVTLRRYAWDKAERQDASVYSVGDVVEFRARGRGGFRPGDRVEVQSASEGRVVVRKNGELHRLPLESAGAFSVYKPVVEQFADGDRIRITQNRRANPKIGQQRLNNGDVFTIRFTKDGKMYLGNGVRFDPSWGHFDHGGIVSTSFASQGDTVDRAFVSASRDSFAASSSRQAYVSASRPRLSLEVYTEDLDGLKAAICRDRAEPSATEIARRSNSRNGSYIKRQVARMRSAAHLGREFLQRQLQRLTQRLPTPPSVGINAGR